MFDPLPPQFSFSEAEERVLAFWEKHDIFGQSLQIRRDAPRFVFYEGPPTANGLPHPGHCLTRAIKDLFPRYQTMCGKLVERKAGWDTHGLPVEVEVCKELGIHTKAEIEAYGVEKFVRKCIESVFRYTREWEQMTRRLGFWVNLEDAYVTFHQSYVESVWWSLKTLFDRGLLYQGHKVVWWWAQGGTALSAGEVGEGYRTVKDPSVYIRFPLRPEPNPFFNSLTQTTRGRRASLLVWTTTPWTLVSNHFAAVGPDVDYSLVHDETTEEYYYIATALVAVTAEKLKHKLVEVAACKGSDLVGLRYTPPFDVYSGRRDYAATDATGQRLTWGSADRTFGDASLGEQAKLTHGGVQADVPFEDLTLPLRDNPALRLRLAWRVLPANFIDLATGTGIVHIAPAYGEVDFELLQTERRRFAGFEAIPLLNAVAPDGTFTVDAPPPYRGRWVKDCDKEIMRELKDRGVLLHQETIEHEYPFCPRAEDDPLIQYARKSWFVRTSQFKDEFLANNDKINWLPEHIKEGRFGDFLRNNVDWALSRERYWGTPLPIWVCEKTGKMEAIGSYAELLAKPGVQGTEVWEAAKKGDPSLPDHLKVHKPYIDEVTYDSPFAPGGVAPGGVGVSPARMRRVPEVIDCWWDAGSMPFAQWGFPHTTDSVRTFVERFPADFISEAIDQTRGWFYGLLSISTLLFQKGGVGVSPATAVTGVTRELIIRKRRKLPHWEAGGSTYFVTFRTGTKPSGGDLVELTPEERTVALNACRHWDGKRMLLHAVVVMPDHVHMLFTPVEKTAGAWWSVSELLHGIKGFSTREINTRRAQTHSVDWSGTVWQDERYDRIIRNEADFEEKWNYIITNPQRKGMDEAYQWLWVEPSHSEDGQDAHPTLPARAYPHPYKTCIVLGHVMGEDALKMSKRTKNYKEPAFIFDTYGADAMRWFFFSAQTPWTSIRFQEANIRDAQREFLVRLYNVFSFFNIYANIDGFEPGAVVRSSTSHSAQQKTAVAGQSETSSAGRSVTSLAGRSGTSSYPTGWRPARERSELDRWIASELHRTIRFVRDSMDRFENYPAAGRLKDFVDALSNWYVRRSRDRFWRPLTAGTPAVAAGTSPTVKREGEAPAEPSADQDKWDAYNTLYEVLLALSQLLAPFTPFFAEVMYQNLTGGQVLRDQGHNGPGNHRAGALNPKPRILNPLSVHLCDYPTADESLIDESLVAEMDLVRDIVSLGRAARTAAKLRVRQPLALVEIILVQPEHTAWLETHRALIAEELNIKQVEFTTEADHYVTYQIKPDFKALGPKFGQQAPKIAAALKKLDPAPARQSLTTAGELVVYVENEAVRLTAQEVQVRLEAKPGWSAAQGRAGVVVVKTELTPELLDEGLIRELIHHVQGLRKEMNLAYEARVTLRIETDDVLRQVVERFADTLKHECLAAEIAFGPLTGDVHDAKVGPHAVRLAVTPRA